MTLSEGFKPTPPPHPQEATFLPALLGARLSWPSAHPGASCQKKELKVVYLQHTDYLAL